MMPPSLHPAPCSSFCGVAGVGFALAVLGLSGGPLIAADKKFAPPPKRRFAVEGGKLDAAVTALAGRLQLTGPQQAGVRVLMVERAKSFEEQKAAARESFRRKLDSLLTENQKKTHRWADAEWGRSDGEGPFGRWGLDKWLGEFGDLTAAQTAELKILVQRQNEAIGSALTGAEKIYEDALPSILTSPQREILERIEARDPVIHIPTEK